MSQQEIAAAQVDLAKRIKCVSTDAVKIGAASAVLVGGAMLVQGDGMKGAAKSAGIQLLASGVTHLVAPYLESDKPAAKDAWKWDSKAWSGLAVEAAVVGGLFTAAERWGRGSCCPVKDFLTSSIADFAASAVIVQALGDYSSQVCYVNTSSA